MKNLRKVSAKQHYLSVARYVAGQSTNLPSRYIKLQNPIQRILIACMMFVIGHFLVRLQIRRNLLSEYLISMLKFIPFGKNQFRTKQSYNMIVYKSIYILANIKQDLSIVMSKILFPLNVFLKVFEFIESICQISQITLHAVHLQYLCRILLTHFVEYLIKSFMIIADLLDQNIRSLTLYTIYALRYVLTIIVLIIEISIRCSLHSLNGSKCILNETSVIFQN